ncbi:MAG: helix-turn-helix domain-containing protein [Candidatus Eremiobacteraeota bacterium]|nr:helix-turn-helix domain-containing protein [Candidatus Eremiobacteraeota bacterium]MBV8645033.1 helix-turn-helix domain-containing protein [Candidatus Eremiobacteraeota bacterium]
MPKPSAVGPALAHPVAYRIITTLGVHGPQTPAALVKLVSGVPSSTLYRHLARLHENGIVEVVDERPARGAVERTYALVRHGGLLDPQEAAERPLDEMIAAAHNFTASLIADLTAYIESERFAMPRDGAYMAMLAAMRLTTAERTELHERIVELAREIARRPDPGGRTRTALYTICIPQEPTSTS